MNTAETRQGLAIRVIWVDDDLIELACILVYGKFTGKSTCYTPPQQLRDFADALSQFSLTAEGRPMFESGLSNGSKACNLRVYTIDKACHMAVHIKMATDELSPRPESVARLELEMLVEAWSLSRFADQLRQISATKAGEAILSVFEVIA